jgi:hypothetical protein
MRCGPCFGRREAEGVLPSGEAAALYDELTADIAVADIVIQPETADMEREFGAVLFANTADLCWANPIVAYRSKC